LTQSRKQILPVAPPLNRVLNFLLAEPKVPVKLAADINPLLIRPAFDELKESIRTILRPGLLRVNWRRRS
jgi:hypothetical protein